VTSTLITLPMRDQCYLNIIIPACGKSKAQILSWQAIEISWARLILIKTTPHIFTGPPCTVFINEGIFLGFLFISSISYLIFLYIQFLPPRSDFWISRCFHVCLIRVSLCIINYSMLCNSWTRLPVYLMLPRVFFLFFFLWEKKFPCSHGIILGSKTIYLKLFTDLVVRNSICIIK